MQHNFLHTVIPFASSCVEENKSIYPRKRERYDNEMHICNYYLKFKQETYYYERSKRR